MHLNITDTVSNITEFAELFGEVFMVLTKDPTYQ